MSFVCVICEESLAFRDPMAHQPSESLHVNTTECGHVFHRHCLADWFTAQKRQQNASNNTRLHGNNKTTCPSCQRVASPSRCLRIFPTEDVVCLYNNPGVKTKAELNNEIIELTERIEEMESNKLQGETEFMNSLQIISIERDTLEEEVRRLRKQLATVTQPAQSATTDTDDIVEIVPLSNIRTPSADECRDNSSPESDTSSSSNSASNSEPVAGTSRELSRINADIIAMNRTVGGLTIGDRVIWMHDDDGLDDGMVLWLGQMKGVVVAGVQFDTGIGDTDGNINGIQLFTCDRDYGRLIAVKELILYKDLYGREYSDDRNTAIVTQN